jgi:hypothetical protein
MEERRRLVALCGMSAEWADDELSFRFTHLAIAEHFLARQVVRLSLDQAVSVLFSVAVSTLCAQLVVSLWQTQNGNLPTQLIAALQDRMSAVPHHDPRRPGAISLGELWAKVHGTGQGHRAARRITVEDLELSGPGQVSLEDAHNQNLVMGPGVELQLTSSHVARLDLSRSSGAALLGDSYKQVREILTQTELATGQSRIRLVLGLTGDVADDVSESDDYFRANIEATQVPIIVNSHDLAPDKNSRLKWVREYGLDVWQDYVRRMQKEQKITLQKVNAGGPLKRRIVLTEKFYEE